MTFLQSSYHFEIERDFFFWKCSILKRPVTQAFATSSNDKGGSDSYLRSISYLYCVSSKVLSEVGPDSEGSSGDEEALCP